MFKYNQKIIFKKFLLDLTIIYLLLLGSLGLIIWVIQAVNYLDYVSEDGHSFFVYFQFTILNFPKIISKLMPVVFFVSLFVTINNYEDKNELKIFWLNGIKKTTFIQNILNYSLIILIISFFFNIFLVPLSQNKARTFIQESNIDFFPSLLVEKIFIDTVKDLTIYIDEKKGNEYENIFIKEKKNNLTRIVHAKKGVLVNNKNDRYIELFNGNISNLNSKNITGFDFQKSKFDLQNYITNSITEFKFQERSTFYILECFFLFFENNDLKEKFSHSCGQKESLPEIQSEIFKRIFKPLYLLVLCMSAGYLIIKNKENGDIKKYRVMIFMYGFFFVILSEFSNTFASKNYTYLFFTILLPIVILILQYFYFIFNQRIKE